MLNTLNGLNLKRLFDDGIASVININGLNNAQNIESGEMVVMFNAKRCAVDEHIQNRKHH